MKYTRFEIPDRKKIGFEGALFQFLVIIPILAISIGYVLSSFIIIPRVQRGSTILTKSTAQTAFKINKIETLYFLQAGLYSSREKAEVLMDGINLKGFNASLGLSKGMYRIVLGVSENLQEMQKLRDNLKNAGYAGIINKIDIQMLDKSGSQELQLIMEYMNVSSNLVCYQQEFIQKSILEKIKLDEKFNHSITKLQSEYDKLNALKLPENVKLELDEFHKYFCDNYSTFVKNADAGELNSLSENLTNEVVSLLDLYKAVAQNFSN